MRAAGGSMVEAWRPRNAGAPENAESAPVKWEGTNGDYALDSVSEMRPQWAVTGRFRFFGGLAGAVFGYTSRSGERRSRTATLARFFGDIKPLVATGYALSVNDCPDAVTSLDLGTASGFSAFGPQNLATEL